MKIEIPDADADHLSVIRNALEYYLDLIRDGDSADEAHHGTEWADAELVRIKRLLATVGVIDNDGVNFNDAPPGYVAKLSEACTGCAFDDALNRRCVINDRAWPCTKAKRKDGKPVIFVKKEP